MVESQESYQRRKQDEATKKRHKTKEDQDNIKIAVMLDRIASEQKTANDEKTPKERGKRRRERFTVAGLYIAAGVALIAIWTTHQDSSDQIGVLTGQVGILSDQLKEMKAERRPWITFAPEDIKITKPLTFEGNSATLEYTVLATNSGKSVASRIVTLAGLYIRPLLRPTPPGIGVTAQNLKDIIRAGAGDFCSEKAINGLGFISGRIVPPNGIYLFDSQNSQSANKENFVMNSAFGDVSAWAPFCIGYQDDSGGSHGTGIILEYSSDTGADHFAPEGAIPGTFSPFGPSWVAY